MPLDRKAQPAEAERAELERVVDALSRWPRLSQLLGYIGQKLFSGELDQINEYNLATEVLGRSKTVFNASEDAIARVETHRLRKRLAAYYETEGRDHPIQIMLPPGSYIPVFIPRPEPKALPDSPGPAPSPATIVAVDTDSQGGKGKGSAVWLTRHWKFSLTGAFIGLGALGAYLYFQSGDSRPTARAAAGVPAAVSVRSGSEALSGPVRLLAGYSGPPRTDSAGNVWNPDQYFSGGGPWQRAAGPLARTSDPFIFEHLRTGDFSYAIPLKTGSYELHLFFSTPVEMVATFNVSLPGQYLLPGFDINSDAMGANIADEKVFRGVSPDADGFLRIAFADVMAPPSLCAIEILPSIGPGQNPIRIIMQTTPQTDSKGQVWHPDNYYMNGQLSTPRPLADSSDPDLFGAERYGHFSYAIPVDVRDTYTVILHFAEFYFTSAASGSSGRLFKVMCNGQTLLDNFDVYREAGSLHEISKIFRHLKPSAQGKLNLTFEPIENNATVSGIEVLDEAK
jgi:hypothetical protein